MKQTILEQPPKTVLAERGFGKLKALGVVFGVLFLLGGILGFVPSVTNNEMFLGIFMVNVPHDVFHIATGLIFLIASRAGAGATRLWFQVSGVIYAIFALLGFMNLNGVLFGIISTMPANSWGHAGLAFVMLIIGIPALKTANRGRMRR